MGGTQRVAKFVKYLPSFGWQPVVITVKDVAYYAEDPSLLRDVRAAQICRTGSLDPQRLLKLLASNKTNTELASGSSIGSKWRTLNRLAAWLFLPDSKVLWLPFAIFRAFKIIRNRNIGCIFTTSPPHSIHLAGLLLQKATKLPWIADFRDGWSRGNFQTEPTRLHKWVNAWLERWVVNRADRVLCVSAGLSEHMMELSRTSCSKFYTVTNGFDLEDMVAAANPRTNKSFTIAYCGALTSSAPVSSFLKGLGRILEAEPNLRSKISVKLVGMSLEPKIEREIHECGLAGVVELTGYVSHLEALENTLHADLLLYPVAPWARSHFIPGKTFEYLASGNQILAIGPCVEGVRILKQHAKVEVVAHEDISAIEKSLLRFYATYQRRLQKKRQVISKYERKELTKVLAALLDEAVGN